MMLEYKSIQGEVKDLDMKGRRVTGYLSAFGNEDYVGDVMVPGAFAKSLKERKDKIFFLNQHNWAQPHGKFEILQEDSKGLYFESMPLPDTSYSNDLLKLYEAGIINEHSIGYSVIKDEMKSGVRMLNEVKLYEGSNVTLGANPETPFTGLKWGIETIDDQEKKLIKAIRNGTFTDDTFSLLEFALKQLRAEAIKIGKESLAEPSDDTQSEPIAASLKQIIKTL